MREKIEIKKDLLYQPTLEWEEEGVFNPTAISVNNDIYIIYRAVKCDNYSRFGYLKINDKGVQKSNSPIITPSEEYEKQGVEDPRITKVGEKYYLLYTAYDGKNARIAGAESKDNIFHFKKFGTISPNITFLEALFISESKRYKNFWNRMVKEKGENVIIWDKDGCLFSEKINGKFAFLHRIEPDIQIVYFDDFFQLKSKEFWEEYFRKIEEKIVMKPENKWEEEKIGAGPSPIKTEKGWLLLYHGVDRNKVYRAGIALLDLENPSKIISRLPFPLFEPTHKWEKEGVVPNVVFPTGAVIRDGILYIFYGCSDVRIGVAEIEVNQIMKILLKRRGRK